MSFKKKIDKHYVTDLYQNLVKNDRVALSQAITLIESQKESHAEFGIELLEKCLPNTGNSIRIGITGTPGVGKSTFIEAMGLIYISKGHKVAVLTIDPSSPLNQGSILGDKSRMEKLSHHSNGYVRSSPARTTLGGTTDRTKESILLCEAAGYDVIIVETVGIGQSETEILNMTDLLLLLVLPGGGDEIQGIKRGIVEVADIIIINKKDKFQKSVVTETLNTFKFALHLKSLKASNWASKVLTCSAITGEGLDQIVEDVSKYLKAIIDSNYLVENRERQNLLWLNKKVEQESLIQIRNRLATIQNMNQHVEQINSRKKSIQRIAKEIVATIFN